MIRVTLVHLFLEHDTLLMLRWYISSKLSTVAGTQCIDRVWQNLKKWLPRKLQAVEKNKDITL